MLKGNGYSQEERLLAALAHGSIIANGIGIIGGVILYLTQKEKSRFIAGQALQAAAYQLVGMIAMIFTWLLWTGLYLLSFLVIDLSGPEPPMIFWVAMGSMVIPLAITVAWLAYGLYGALRSFQGRDFRYRLVGRFAELE